MLELRIYSGLHRGATLPLIETDLSLGCDEAADVVLVDEGMAALHARLKNINGCWILEAAGGKIFNEHLAEEQLTVDLADGGFARLGEVWIGIAKENASWLAIPSLPDPEQLFATPGPDAQTNGQENTEENVQIDRADKTAHVDRRKKNISLQRRHIKKMLFGGTLLTLVLSVAATYAMSVKPDLSKSELALAKKSLLPVQHTPAAAPVQAGSDEASQHDAGHASTAQLNQPGASALAELLKKRLEEADLLANLELKLEEQRWELKGDLDEEQGERLSRVTKNFMAEHQITFPVKLKIVKPEELLPFSVRQVVTGNNASLVTGDGTRLFVGEEYRGMRLLAIQDGKLIFGGKRKIEMIW